MGIIQLKEANCKNCYKCIRYCEVKSIKFSDEQASVIEDQCILCGKCTLICPQNAKNIESDMEKVKNFAESNSRLVASLAPSYTAAFNGATLSQMSAALKKLGFSKVEETAIGATEVSLAYSNLIKEKKMKNIITTACPSTVLLVEKYYPDLVQYLAPVVTPATAHAKMLKEIYGNRTKVVFIGPCISKKYEASRGNDITGVLTFDELKIWLDEKKIAINEEDTDVSELHNTSSRMYPIPGGIIETISPRGFNGYKNVVVDGLDRCIEVLNSMRKNEIQDYFIEMVTCAGSCVKGPGMHTLKKPFLVSKTYLINNKNKKTYTKIPLTENLKVNLWDTYNPIKLKDNIPDEKSIRDILISIGKITDGPMLNCGTCGYFTCREKAIAVYHGKADLKMCLPYMREKAESMSNIILENTPNAIFMTDCNFNILEYNKAVTTIFNVENKKIIGESLETIVKCDDLTNIKDIKQPAYDLIGKSFDGSITVNLCVVQAPKGDYIIIAKDVTKEDEKNKELERMRKETIATAKRVIDKQMRAAQEIASLLGETTGETKAVLTKLTKI